ncbi:4'-phosphopantetheinyl transferase family protein [Streptomyces sp. NPDC127033]|uniref:4'-phosphopantetheinyl transferase family protein n=1 Tax=Streptomyces sp. NPDC127033 TaxID=3347110 RepID=UPI00365C0D37
MDGRPGPAPDTVTVLWCTTDGDERGRARALLVRQVAAVLEVDPSAIWMEREPGGRPVMAGAAEGVRVSMSHTRGALAVAFTAGGHVGVDVEALRVLPGQALARRWLDKAEAAWVAALPEGERSVGFLWLWTQKEAVGKALGLGLRAGGMSRRMPSPGRWPLIAGASPVPLELPDDPGTAADAALVVGGSHVVGVAVRGVGGTAARVEVRRVTSRTSD